MSTEIEISYCLLYDLRMKIMLLSLLLLKTCSTINLRHLRTFSQVSILHFQIYINSLNGDHKLFLQCVYSNKYTTKQNKTAVSLGGERANHGNLM